MSSGITSMGGETFGSLPSPSSITTSSTATRLHRHLHHEISLGINGNTNSQNNSNSNSTPSTTGALSIPIRLVQFGISILLRIRAKLPAFLQPWFWVGLWFGMAVFGLVLFAGFHTKIFEILEAVATFIKNLGRGGPPIIMLGLFLTSFPPLFGYSSLVTMSGYIYGFGYGLVIAYTSALFGSVACFYLCRRWFQVQVRTLMARKQSLKSVVKAVEKKGFKLMILIRLAPYPFNVMNALLSATHVPLSTFTIATAISLSKLILHVYIGSTLSSLATAPIPPSDGDQTSDGDNHSTPSTDPYSHGQNLKIIVMLISMLLGIGVGAYVWIVAKREIAASEDIRIERRRKRRESIRLSRSMSNSSGPSSSVSTSGRVSGRAMSGRMLLPRNASNNESDRTPNFDLSAGSSDFVGGAIPMSEYQDYDDGYEDQALVGRRTPLLSLSPRFEYGTDSEPSDFDDEDDDMSDMERGVDDDQNPLLNAISLPSTPHQHHHHHHQHHQHHKSPRKSGEN